MFYWGSRNRYFDFKGGILVDLFFLKIFLECKVLELKVGI